MIRRVGSKAKLVSKIAPHFPYHKIWIEPFFGSGSMFFYKPHKADYSILNDYDQDIYNLFLVAKDQREELIELLSITPMHEQLFHHWKENEETDPVKKALRFLFLSSFSYLGKKDTFRVLHSDVNYKYTLRNLLKKCGDYFAKSMFRNKDFREFFNDIHESDAHIPNKLRFIYADPPYVGTTNTYSTPVWHLSDLEDLINVLIGTGIKFMISEFNTPAVVDLFKEYNLEIIEIGERRTIKNERIEVIAISYPSPVTTDKSGLLF